jgi:hypothetical protein
MTFPSNDRQKVFTRFLLDRKWSFLNTSTDINNYTFGVDLTKNYIWYILYFRVENNHYNDDAVFFHKITKHNDTQKYII